MMHHVEHGNNKNLVNNMIYRRADNVYSYDSNDKGARQ